MNQEQWQPIYQQILQDMGYSRADDEHAAHLLSQLLKRHRHTARPETLRRLIQGKDVLVCGNAPTLSSELAHTNTTDYDLIIAADGATETLMREGLQPDIIVTDLDAENIEPEIQASEQGSIVLVHAHGDNIPVLEKIVPQLHNVIGTTQSTPLSNVHNYGGFTDGDRAAHLAAHHHAASITLIGFDFEDPDVTSTKKKKLKWAQKLVNMIIEEPSTSTPRE